MEDRKIVWGVGLALLAFLAFWAGVIYIVLHFLSKFW